MKFVNLTKRMIIVLDDKNQPILRLPRGERVVTVPLQPGVQEQLGLGDGRSVDVVSYDYKTDVHGIPDPAPDTVYVVSYAVLRALNNSRPDVVAPDTSPQSAVRDPKNGDHLGVRRFCKL